MTHLLIWKVLALLGLSLLLVFPELGGRWFRLGERLLASLARHRALSLCIVGGASLVLSGSLSLLVRMPQPFAHDEFSYLLAADTFSHGRLTNPPHPLWTHFETFHVIQQPTYASKYPPGQGLALAAGQMLTRRPIVGVWLSTALACAAACWMLYGWLPPTWALAGGLVVVFHPITVEWGQCYWGGSVAMGGGALLLGSLPRIVEELQARYAVVFGFGMAVLANTRPYEGMILAIVSLAALLWWIAERRDSVTIRSLSTNVVLPFSLVMALTFAVIGFYNFRVTGSAFRLPYQVHEATYAVTPLFIWERPRPIPPYRHEVLRQFHVELATRAYRAQNTLRTWLWMTYYKYADLLTLHFPTAFRYLLLPLLGLVTPFALRWHHDIRIASVVLAGFVFGTLPEVFMSYRYTAPALSLLVLVVLLALRHLNVWTWRAMPTGRSLVRVCTVACVMAFALTNARWVFEPEEMALNSWGTTRASLARQLEGDGQRHLVIVRYGPAHSPHKEWVYNAADIDNAPVVWARGMDSVSDQKLLDYFEGRRVWLLRIDDDADPPRLTRYGAPGARLAVR